MLEIREEELNMVNGGADLCQLIVGTPENNRFHRGDKVRWKEHYEEGVGTVVGDIKNFDIVGFGDGWNYHLQGVYDDDLYPA